MWFCNCERALWSAVYAFSASPVAIVAVSCAPALFPQSCSRTQSLAHALHIFTCLSRVAGPGTAFLSLFPAFEALPLSLTGSCSLSFCVHSTYARYTFASGLLVGSLFVVILFVGALSLRFGFFFVSSTNRHRLLFCHARIVYFLFTFLSSLQRRAFLILTDFICRLRHFVPLLA